MKEYLVENTKLMKEYLESVKHLVDSKSFNDKYVIVLRRDSAHLFWFGVGYGEFCERKKHELWNVISPDGFSIHPIDTYPTLEKAKEAFNEWSKNYERQGYYSSVKGRIELSELEKHCTYKKLN